MCTRESKNILLPNMWRAREKNNLQGENIVKSITLVASCYTYHYNNWTITTTFLLSNQ